MGADMKLTLKVLETAPVGSRAVFDFGYGVKTVLHKISDTTWQYSRRHRFLPGFKASTENVASGTEGHHVTIRIHPPAPVRVTQWRAGPVPWFTRYCRVCGDFDMFEGDSDAAHDDARTHAKEHAQERVA
jgi:hypothetical protein